MTGTKFFHWDDIAAQGDAKADQRAIAGMGGELKRVAIADGNVADLHQHHLSNSLWLRTEQVF
jgi:hypothetical protein